MAKDVVVPENLPCLGLRVRPEGRTVMMFDAELYVKMSYAGYEASVAASPGLQLRVL